MAVIRAGYEAKLAAAANDKEKWATVLELQNHLAMLGHAVQQRNAAMLFANARPLAGGFAPKAVAALDRDGIPFLGEL